MMEPVHIGAIMEQERIDNLTQRQRDCLRLVAQGYTSKQIGRQLGISYSTVDNHLQAATRELEVSGRSEAARLLTRYEAPPGSRQELPRYPLPVAGTGVFEDTGPANERRGWRRRLSTAFPPVGGRLNDLSPSRRLFAVGRIAFLSSLTFIACVMVIRMCFRILG